jgi:hypothetical protein
MNIRLSSAKKGIMAIAAHARQGDLDRLLSIGNN